MKKHLMLLAAVTFAVLELGALGIPVWVDGRLQGNLSGASIKSGTIVWRPSGNRTMSFRFPSPLDISEADSIFIRLRVPDVNKGARVTLSITCANSGTLTWNLPLRPEVEWNSCSTYVAPLLKKAGGRTDLRKVTAIRLRLRGPVSGAIEIADLRFSPRHITFEIPRLPPPSDRIYWPEYTGQDIINATMSDPDLKAKLAEIDRLRTGFLAATVVPLNPNINPEERRAKALKDWEMVAPDGSIADMSEDLIRKLEIEMKSPRLKQPHEGVTRHAFPRLVRMLNSWYFQTIPHTDENRTRLVRALNYYFAYELNRKGESGRWVSTCFHAPDAAARAYHVFLKEMEAVEAGSEKSVDLVRLNQLSKAVAVLAFTQPEVNIPGPVLTVDSFRNSGSWCGGNFGYRQLYGCALVCRNPRMLDVVAQVAKGALSVISYNTRDQAFWTEGLTADGSGWGHGLQNYIFRYPADGLRTVMRVLKVLKGTSWARGIEPEQWRLAVEYIRTALWYCWKPDQYGPTILLNERFSMQYNPQAGYMGIRPILSIAELLRDALPDQCTDMKEEVENLIAVASGSAPEASGCRYFWNNDDLIGRGEDYFFGINMFSRRAATNEIVGVASIYTDFLGDGSAFIMRSPETYTVGKGFWRPTAIPGVTARQGDYKFLVDNWEGYLGIFNFAGGIAADQFGVCGFIYGKAPNKRTPIPLLYGVKACKSYFLFGPELVCLGSGIEDRTPIAGAPLETTVDNTVWKAPVRFSTDGGLNLQTAAPGSEIKGDAEGMLLAEHNGVGYVLLGAKPFLSGRTEKERWLQYNEFYNKKQKDRPTSSPMLRLGFSHGNAAKNESYAYLVNMRIPDFTALRAYAEALPVRILSNTPRLQAVRHLRHRVTQAVFFTADAKLNDGERIWQVSSPAVLMIREGANGTFTVTVADPQQQNNKQSITVSCQPALPGGQAEVVIPLPRDPYCGKAVTVQL